MIRWLLGTDSTPETITIRQDHLRSIDWTHEQQSLNNTGIVSDVEAMRVKDFWRRVDGKKP